MSTEQLEALLMPTPRHGVEPLPAVYSAWRGGGSAAMLARHVLSQVSVAAVLLLFYVATVATDYAALRGHLSHPICPGGEAANEASLFATDCWDYRPIDGARRPGALALAVLLLTATATLVEAVVFVKAFAAARRAEDWWQCRFGASAPSLASSEWDAVAALLLRDAVPLRTQTDLEHEIVLGRGDDGFTRVYTEVLPRATVTRTLHAAIAVAAGLSRATGWPLRSCLQGAAAGTALAAPYVAVSKMCRYIFRSVQEVRTSGIGVAAGRRVLTRGAAWRARRLGELPHRFEARAAAGKAEAAALLASIPAPPLARAAATAVLTVGGAFTVLVLTLTVVLDEHVLTAYMTPGKSVAFYTALIGVALAGARAVSGGDPGADLHAGLRRVEAILGTISGDTLAAQLAALSAMAPHRAVEVATEVASVLVTPVLLLTTVAPKAAEISGALQPGSRPLDLDSVV